MHYLDSYSIIVLVLIFILRELYLSLKKSVYWPEVDILVIGREGLNGGLGNYTEYKMKEITNLFQMWPILDKH